MQKSLKTKSYIFILIILFLFNNHAVANSLSDEAYEWLKEYISIDTVNPPGNEINAVNFYIDILTKENILFEMEESAPGRANIWARLKGGNKPALILLQHTDVGPANK